MTTVARQGIGGSGLPEALGAALLTVTLSSRTVTVPRRSFPGRHLSASTGSCHRLLVESGQLSFSRSDNAT